MNDSSTLGTVRASLTTAKDSLTDVHMTTPLDTIVRHGRATRRRHRLIGLAGTAGVAAAAALVVGLTGVTGSAPADTTGTIRTAAFTIVSHANGTITLTIKPGVLLDPSTLQNDLAHDGIPAMVTVGSFCSSDPAPAGFSQVVVPFQPRRQSSGWLQRREGVTATVTINPVAMPAGTELSFGNFQLTNTQQTSVALIDTGSYTCTSTAPTASPSGGGMMITDGAPAS